MQGLIVLVLGMTSHSHLLLGHFYLMLEDFKIFLQSFILAESEPVYI